MLFRMIVSKLTLFAKDIANGMANVAALGVTHKVFDTFWYCTLCCIPFSVLYIMLYPVQRTVQMLYPVQRTVHMLYPVQTGVNDLLQILTREITIYSCLACKKN